METHCFNLLSNLSRRKVLQFGLCLVWFSGVFLIWVSFYGTQMLMKEQGKMNTQSVSGDGFEKTCLVNITIFTAPKPFIGLIGERQVLAVKSWLGLSENLKIILFSRDPSVFSFARSFGHRVSVETNVDFTFLATPFFHSMVARSMASSSDVSVLIDPDTVLLSNFITTLEYAVKLDEDWLLVALTQNVSHFPFHLNSDGKTWLADDGKQAGFRKMQEYLGSAKSCADRMLIAWNNGDVPLHRGVLPPFLYGKGFHNQWFVSEALNSDFRLVVDASFVISSFYIHDSYEREDILLKRNWESSGNSLLASAYGSLSFHGTNYSNLFKFFECDQSYLLVNTAQNIAYPLKNSAFRNFRGQGISLALVKRKLVKCANVIKSLEGIESCFGNGLLRSKESISLSTPLESLLSMLADSNKTIVLGVAGYSYKDMMMSWACRLWHLKLHNFLVCSLDQDAYEFAVLQGLPVINCFSSPANISFDDCHFGTECFQRVTKVKSRMVLHILKLGYNVLLSDVDVYWFKNPLPLLTSFGPSVLVAQSDEYNSTEPINKPRRLNSGFYYVNSDNQTIAALERVVKHATTSNRSEQPSFYDTLCGEDGIYRVGDDRCWEPETNVTVQFLDRDLFPNGAHELLWQKKNTRRACLRRGSFVIHNNWVRGRKLKLERQVKSGLWEYDMNTRMCLHKWHRNKDTAYF